MESLHTILLGPYKYLLKTTIPSLSKMQKDEVLAGFVVSITLDSNVEYSVTFCHHQSFVGRDYKAWAQMAPFVIYPHLSSEDKMRQRFIAQYFEIRLVYCCRYLRFVTVNTTNLPIVPIQCSGRQYVKNLLILQNTDLQC